MQEYRYSKSGYTRFAVCLLYGKRSKHAEQFSVYDLPQHDRQRLRYTEVEQARDTRLGPGINSCTRELHFGDGRMLSSDFTQGTGINTILHYVHQNDGGNVHLGSVYDFLFTNREYEYFEYHWDDQVQAKVDALSRLLRALDTGEEGIYPTVLGDFPNIAKYLLAYPEHFPRREALWT